VILYADEILGMLRHLYPYLNRNDRQIFIDDISESYPENFALIFPAVRRKHIAPEEKKNCSNEHGAKYMKTLDHLTN